jgi:ABC-type bacteriocin/lantibiotic exporter with double-glycine peptidase domain
MRLNVPLVKQKNDWTCGRAALEMLFKFYKTQIPKDLNLFCSPEDGIQPDAIKAILYRQYGHYTCGRMTIEILKGFIRDQKPVLTPIIWDLKTPHESHWVVVHGFTNKKIYYLCPVDGEKFRYYNEWKQLWHCWGGQIDYINWGVTSWPI